MLSEGYMTYNYRTKRAIKFWVWLCTGLNALAVCTALWLVSGELKTLIFGAVAAVLQVIHGVRVSFFNKTLVNMLPGFGKFQMLLLLVCTICVSAEIGGAYGWAIFALAAAEYIVSLVIPKRRAIKEGIKELLLI